MPKGESNKFVYDTSPETGKPLTTHQFYDGKPHPWEFKGVWHIEPLLDDPDTQSLPDRSTPILPSLTQSDRTRKRRSMIVGTLEDSHSESQAQAEVDKLRLNISSFTSSLPSKDISVDQLVNHYREFELPDIFSRMSRKESRMSQENPEPS
jgi:hypothetical protein